MWSSSIVLSRVQNGLILASIFVYSDYHTIFHTVKNTEMYRKNLIFFNVKMSAYFE